VVNGSVVRLLVLASIWGGSFIFMRVVAPALGPVLTAELRVAIGGGALLAYFALIGFKVEWRAHWTHYVVIGVVNSAIPFLLYAFAAMHIPASYSAIINSTAPLFSALFAAIWLGERLTLMRVAAFVLGGVGVAMVARLGPAAPDPWMPAAIGACVLAAACYGLSGVYVKKRASHVKPLAIAGASQVCAAIAILPAVPFASPLGDINGVVVANLLGLALLCSGFAYMLFYRLIADLGPTRALTVTFLIPVFGVAWGVLFLGERVTWSMALGCALVVAATMLVVRRPRPRAPINAAAEHGSSKATA
jgi:drug/metabolite transporter (DMT)-like permease